MFVSRQHQNCMISHGNSILMFPLQNTMIFLLQSQKKWKGNLNSHIVLGLLITITSSFCPPDALTNSVFVTPTAAAETKLRCSKSLSHAFFSNNRSENDV